MRKQSQPSGRPGHDVVRHTCGDGGGGASSAMRPIPVSHPRMHPFLVTCIRFSSSGASISHLRPSKAGNALCDEAAQRMLLATAIFW